jgi:hypothetical protein
MRGYDPRIHDENQQQKLLRPLSTRAIMDCRGKPDNDPEIRAGINGLLAVLLCRHKLDTPMTGTPP